MFSDSTTLASGREYRAHGFVIRSEVELSFPEAAGGDPADVSCRLATDDWFRQALAHVRLRRDEGSWYQYGRLPDGADVLQFPGVCEFVISPSGHAIACRALPGGTPESLQTYLSGPALSSALVKQGVEPLHATTVVSGGVAFGLLGRSGLGKSTLASEFLRAGDSLLTDDMLI